MNLNVSNLFFELAVIFLPGFIWMKIHVKYGPKKERSQFDMILNAFLFGMISYFLLFLIFWISGKSLALLSLDAENKKLLDVDTLPEIMGAVGIAILGGFGFLYIENYKFLTRGLQFFRATNTFGDEDVWDFVFNSSSEDVKWIYFRDFNEEVVYFGYVRLFSENGKLRELLLESVVVYNFDGVELYTMPMLYLARTQENIHIEFPGLRSSRHDGRSR